MDPTYAPVKVYFDQGGDRLTIAAGGTLRVAAGAITTNGNASAFIADPTAGGTVDTQARTAINAILDVLIAQGLMAGS